MKMESEFMREVDAAIVRKMAASYEKGQAERRRRFRTIQRSIAATKRRLLARRSA